MQRQKCRGMKQGGCLEWQEFAVCVGNDKKSEAGGPGLVACISDQELELYGMGGNDGTAGC